MLGDDLVGDDRGLSFGEDAGLGGPDARDVADRVDAGEARSRASAG